ncbi:hypothetical protein ACFL14_01425 [Patescibacteria group bacterium]
MENYSTRIGKILTTQKLPDRFIKASVHHPKNPNEEEHGTLIFLVEILSPWFPSTEIGHAIIDTTIREYYKGSKYADTLTRFEEALKKVNEKLAEMASRGVNDWIGHINCSIIALKRNTLYVSHSGNTQIYLFRDKNLSEVTEDISGKNSSPISTFITITNGSLSKGDKVLITNQKLLDTIPLQSLREIINYTDVIKSVQQIGKILKRNRVQNVNSILFELNTEKELMNLEPDQYLGEDTIYLDQEGEGWLGSILKDAKPKIATSLNRGNQSGNRIWEKFLIQANTTAQKVSPHARRFTTNLGHKVLKTWHNYRGKNIKKPSSNVDEDQKKFFVQKQQNIRQGKSNFLNLLNNVFVSLVKFIQSLFLIKNRRRLYITLVILFVLVFSTSLFFTLRNNWNSSDNVKIEEVIDDAKTDIEEAKSLIGNNNFGQARELLLAALNNLDKYSNNQKYKKEIESLLDEISQYIDKADQTTRFDSSKQLTKITDNFNFQQILFTDNIFYYIQDSNSLNSINTNGEKSTVSELPSSIEDVKLLSFIDDGKILFYTNDLKVYQYNLNSEKFTRLDASGGWEETDHLQTFATNIYLLDSDMQIYKHTKVALGYSKAINFILESQLPEENAAIDFAIDGNVYILGKKDGYQLYKFYNGRLESDFKLSTSDSGLGLSSAKKIITSENLNSIYMLENNISDFDGQKINRILEFSKDGSFVRQYKFSNKLGNIADFSINAKLRTIYCSFDTNKLYEFEQ